MDRQKASDDIRESAFPVFAFSRPRFRVTLVYDFEPDGDNDYEAKQKAVEEAQETLEREGFEEVSIVVTQQPAAEPPAA